ncbi:MAG TPA: deoxyhypusine synthase family protein [Chloroflexota bacterium]|nr:deoxyhypusine synthase family protein [Chloroflexota bacterium]
MSDRTEEYDRARERYFRHPVERVAPEKGVATRELFARMERAAGPIRNLAQVYLYWEEMLTTPRQAVWMTIAGAYIPFGLGGTMRTLLDSHYVDVLVTTPAQLTHDLTEIRGHRHYHGSEEVDDNELQRLDVNRYWTVFGDEQELNTNDDVVAEFAETLPDDRPLTQSEYFYRLGAWLPGSGHGPVDGMLTAAARSGIPIFCPSPGDADVMSDLAHSRKRTGRRLVIDPVKEILDMVAYNAALEDAGWRAGLVALGGGAPRNYGQQAMACAYMLDRTDLKRYNYGLRISLDPVQTGGLSGSTISEGKTWKKYAADTKIAEYFGDFMAPLVQMGHALVDAVPAPRSGPTVRYADDGRLLVKVQDREVDVQSEYGYR